ncbi:signal peptidase II [Thalassotalea eurytherma]|uniref:Lipoprotein signal peptidase n=1 Tax=Thalassotalea eurytherma TaxID=1144278 RepID=A0ABQ6H2P2_9GAMM|nr:signal peptidase II [Thalassotalea eurytherma]GLX81784.1 lipoprotein signal peptidase [Thalassotalea eurytherma]
MMNNTSSLKWLWLTLIFLVVDQATKHYVASNMDLYQSIEILPFFHITYVHNLGAAFSFLADQSGWQRWFFATIATVASIVFTYWLYKTPANNKQLCAAFALLLSGALGNLIDRVLLGYVIDFLDFTIVNYRWPAFNIADSVIFIGAALMIIDSFKKEEPAKTPSNS